MDFFQWCYDVPGNIQGIVIAENDMDAKQRVVNYLTGKFGGCDRDLVRVEWLEPSDHGICVISEM